MDAPKANAQGTQVDWFCCRVAEEGGRPAGEGGAAGRMCHCCLHTAAIKTTSSHKTQFKVTLHIQRRLRANLAAAGDVKGKRGRLAAGSCTRASWRRVGRARRKKKNTRNKQMAMRIRSSPSKSVRLCPRAGRISEPAREGNRRE